AVADEHTRDVSDASEVARRMNDRDHWPSIAARPEGGAAEIGIGACSPQCSAPRRPSMRSNDNRARRARPELARYTGARRAHSKSAERSVIREPELVVAHLEAVAFADDAPLDALPGVFDAVRRAHVDDVVVAVQVLDHRVLTRHVRILDREIARLAAA